MLQTNFVQTLLIDLIAKVNLSLHKEQNLINFVHLIEKYLLGIDPSWFQTLNYSQHEFFEVAVLPRVKLNSYTIEFEKVALILKEGEEISELLEEIRIQKAGDDGNLDIFWKLFQVCFVTILL